MNGQIDMSVVQELLDLSDDGDPELLIDLIQMFLEDGPSRVQSILEGLAEGDLEKVERAAHSLKGSAGNLGARKVQDIAEQLQVSSRQGDADVVKGQVESLPQAFAAAEQDFRELLEQYS